jgi:hypothetical protein
MSLETHLYQSLSNLETQSSTMCHLFYLYVRNSCLGGSSDKRHILLGAHTCEIESIHVAIGNSGRRYQLPVCWKILTSTDILDIVAPVLRRNRAIAATNVRYVVIFPPVIVQ